MSIKPFQVPKLKIARADRHIQELQTDVAAFLAKEPFGVLLIRKKTTNAFEIRAMTRVSTPLEFSIIFGDVAHNLRSALDNLMNDCVSLCGVTPKKVYFPFAKSKTALEGEIKRKMRGAPDDLKDLVRSFSPYSGGNLLLRALHDLNIQDKHQTIITHHHKTTFSLEYTETEPIKPGTRRFITDVRNAPTSPIDKKGWPVDQRSFEILGKIGGATPELIINPDLPLGGVSAIKAAIDLRDLTQSIVKTFEAHFKRRGKPTP